MANRPVLLICLMLWLIVGGGVFFIVALAGNDRDGSAFLEHQLSDTEILQDEVVVDEDPARRHFNESDVSQFFDKQNIQRTNWAETWVVADRHEGEHHHLEIDGSDLLQATCDRDQGGLSYIFVSFSLGEALLTQIIQQADECSTLVFRGIGDGMMLTTFIHQVRLLIGDNIDSPAIIIDPILFQRFSVSRVPAVVHYRPSSDGLRTELLAGRVTGLWDPSWLREKLRHATEPLDYGLRGPTVDITEPDLIELMKTRWQQLNKEAVVSRVLSDTSTPVTPVFLPLATENTVTRFIPGVTLSKTVTDATGRLIYPVGATINPLALMPFTQQLLVFDGTQSHHIDWIKKLVSTNTNGPSGSFSRQVLLTTALPEPQSLSGLITLERELGLPVYPLTAEIASRFKLQAIPATVHAEGQVFVVATRTLIRSDDFPKTMIAASGDTQ